MPKIIKPMMLDETGKEIVKALKDLSGASGLFVSVNDDGKLTDKEGRTWKLEPYNDALPVPSISINDVTKTLYPSASAVNAIKTVNIEAPAGLDKYYRIDGGSDTPFSEPFNYSRSGAHTIEAWTKKGNVTSEKAVLQFNIVEAYDIASGTDTAIVITPASSSVNAPVEGKSLPVDFSASQNTEYPYINSNKSGQKKVLPKTPVIAISSAATSDSDIATATHDGMSVNVTVLANPLYTDRSTDIEVVFTNGATRTISVSQSARKADFYYGYMTTDARLNDGNIATTVADSINAKFMEEDSTAVFTSYVSPPLEHDTTTHRNVYRVEEPTLSGKFVHDFFAVPKVDFGNHQIMRCQGSYDEEPNTLFGICKSAEVTINGLPYVIFAYGTGRGGNNLTDFVFNKK